MRNIVVNDDYIDQSLSTFLKSVFFGGVLIDVNYIYLLLMLCEIIDRIESGVGENFLEFLKI